MAKSGIFYIAAAKDELTNTFLQPIFGESIEELTRVFKSIVNNTPIWKDNASDFSFWCLGTFNQETGEIFPHITKLINGRSVLEVKTETYEEALERTIEGLEKERQEEE